MTFFKTSEFLALKKEWEEKLKQSGFVDIENDKGLINSYNHRTNIYRTKEETSRFYSLLTDYLNDTQTINVRDRLVLTLYSEGVKVSGDISIMSMTGWSRRTIHYIIAIHKRNFIK